MTTTTMISEEYGGCFFVPFGVFIVAPLLKCIRRRRRRDYHQTRKRGRRLRQRIVAAMLLCAAKRKPQYSSLLPQRTMPLLLPHAVCTVVAEFMPVPSHREEETAARTLGYPPIVQKQTHTKHNNTRGGGGAAAHDSGCIPRKNLARSRADMGKQITSPAISRTYLPLLVATLLPPPHGWRGYGRSFSDKQEGDARELGYPFDRCAWSRRPVFMAFSGRRRDIPLRVRVV